MAKLGTTVGAFIGLLNPDHEGRILLRRRVEENSIIPGQSFRGNWELPGGGVQEAEKFPYNHLVLEAVRELKEEVGIALAIAPNQIFSIYTALFKGPQGYDLAGVIPVVAQLEPTIGETLWVSPGELNELARLFVSATEAKKQGLAEAQGLVSGWGKRMHWMALCALTHSPNQNFIGQAQTTIAGIQKAWQ